MSGFSSWRGLSASIIFISVSAGVAHGEEADNFGWSITPYLWATETSVDLTFRDDDLRFDFDYQGPMAGFNFRF